MFTGIIQDVGTVLALERRQGDVRLHVGVERISLVTTGEYRRQRRLFDRA